MCKLIKKSYKVITLFKLFFSWLRRKSFLIIAAFMLGMSNVILEEVRTLNDSQLNTEQEQKLTNNEDE